MATTVIQEWLPHAGAVWSRIIDLIYEVCLDDTKTLGFDPHSVSGYRCNQINVNQGADQTQYVLIDVAMPATEKYNFEYFFTLPGLKRSPPVMPYVAGSRNTLDYWDSKIPGIRSLFTSNAVGWTVVQVDSQDYTVALPPTRFKGAAWSCKKGLHYGLDYVMAVSEDSTPTDGYPGAIPDISGSPALAPVQIVSSGGGGSTDLAPVVEALNDIARRDVVTAIDNGNVSVWQFSGDIVEP